MPQPPPPPKLGAGIEGEVLLPEPEAQLNEDITFLTSVEEHLGHSVLFSAGYKLCRSENFSSHFKHMYS